MATTSISTSRKQPNLFEAVNDDLREEIKSFKDSDAITAFEQRPASSKTLSAIYKLRLLDSMMNPR